MNPCLIEGHAHDQHRRSPPPSRFRWRVVDIVVASVIAVACGVVFLLWNVAYPLISKLLDAVLPGLGALVRHLAPGRACSAR